MKIKAVVLEVFDASLPMLKAGEAVRQIIEFDH